MIHILPCHPLFYLCQLYSFALGGFLSAITSDDNASLAKLVVAPDFILFHLPVVGPSVLAVRRGRRGKSEMLGMSNTAWVITSPIAYTFAFVAIRLM
jgi:hypothetical protein